MRNIYLILLFITALVKGESLFAEDSHSKDSHEEVAEESTEVDESDQESSSDKEGHSEQKKSKGKARPISLLNDPRGLPDLTICSQNLNNYGIKKLSMMKLGITSEEYLAKQKAIAQRIVHTRCDVVALQEIVSRSEEEGKQALTELAEVVSLLGGRHFEVKVGSSNESTIRNGFMVAKDRADIINSLSYTKVELPKISDKQKPRFFLRSPIEIQITARSLEDGSQKSLTLINFHSKSKSGSAKDPTELQWETYRMEMSEAIRRIIEVRHRKSLISPENLLVVMGDRNANFDMASAKILDGSLRLSDFKADSYCRLSKRGVPLCKPGAQSAQILFSVLTTDPHTKLLPGSYTFKKVYSWLDDILISSDALPFAWTNYDKAADYDSGVVYEPKLASDHAMVYVRLNW